jgi:hypothetical protein
MNTSVVRHLFALVAAAPVLAAAAPARPTVDLQCVSLGGAGHRLECTVRLRQPDGAPLADAGVTLSATMPSMPMAHRVRPAVAVATGVPGEYRGRIELEMTGAWAVEVDVTGPVRDRVARTLRIEACDGDRRCPALPAPSIPPAAAAAASHRH